MQSASLTMNFWATAPLYGVAMKEEYRTLLLGLLPGAEER